MTTIPAPLAPLADLVKRPDVVASWSYEPRPVTGLPSCLRVRFANGHGLSILSKGGNAYADDSTVEVMPVRFARGTDSAEGYAGTDVNPRAWTPWAEVSGLADEVAARPAR